MDLQELCDPQNCPFNPGEIHYLHAGFSGHSHSYHGKEKSTFYTTICSNSTTCWDCKDRGCATYGENYVMCFNILVILVLKVIDTCSSNLLLMLLVEVRLNLNLCGNRCAKDFDILEPKVITFPNGDKVVVLKVIDIHALITN